MFSGLDPSGESLGEHSFKMYCPIAPLKSQRGSVASYLAAGVAKAAPLQGTWRAPTAF